MKKRYKLLEILATFDNKEIRQMRKLLRSPFFALRKDIKDLFEYLIKHQAKQKVQLSLEDLFKKIYPQQKFDVTRIRGTMSDLLERIEDFLLISHRRKDKLQARLMLSSIYRKRKLEKSYQSSINKTEQLIQQQQKQNGHYYQQVLHFHLEKMKFQINTKRTDHLYFQEISETSDILFLIQKLQNACSQLSHQSVYKTDYDLGLLKHFIETLEQEERYMRVPAISIFYYCFRFLKENNLEYFQKFKTELSSHRSYFTVEDLQAPYRLAINFCIRKLNENDLYFAREGLELYQEGLAEGILLENNLIPRFSFNNMVAMALQLQEYQWVENFINQYAEQLDEKYRQQTVSFNFARLEFDRQAYGKALIHLQGAEYDDLVNKLIAKMLLIKIYFELEAFESLQSSLDSFQQFIRRREVSDYHRTNFLKIIHYIRKILAIPDFEKSERITLRNKIETESVLSERDWLLEKL